MGLAPVTIVTMKTMKTMAMAMNGSSQPGCEFPAF
jgi:hypothetical protein